MIGYEPGYSLFLRAGTVPRFSLRLHECFGVPTAYEPLNQNNCSSVIVCKNGINIHIIYQHKVFRVWKHGARCKIRDRRWWDSRCSSSICAFEAARKASRYPSNDWIWRRPRKSHDGRNFASM